MAIKGNLGRDAVFVVDVAQGFLVVTVLVSVVVVVLVFVVHAFVVVSDFVVTVCL